MDRKREKEGGRMQCFVCLPKKNVSAFVNSADLQMRHQKLLTLARHFSVGHFLIINTAPEWKARDIFRI